MVESPNHFHLQKFASCFLKSKTVPPLLIHLITTLLLFPSTQLLKSSLSLPFKPCPSWSINGNDQNNGYSLRDEQDQLILSAITDSISLNPVHFIAYTRVSHDAWTIIVNTHVKPHRGKLN